MQSGDLATWVGSIGTSGSLLLGMVLLWRDHNARRDDIVRAHEAQARRVAMALPRSTYGSKGPHQGKEMEGLCVVYVQGELTNNSDDTIHDVRLTASLSKADKPAPGLPAYYTLAESAVIVGDTIRITLKTALEYPPGATASPSFTGEVVAEWSDGAGYRWRRGTDLRLVKVSEPLPRWVEIAGHALHLTER